MTSLVTLQEFADFRGVDLDETDAHAIQVIEAASATVRRYCGQSFDLVSDDVILDGTGTGALLLPQMPVAEVDYVATLDRDGLETEVTNYRVDPAGILWTTGCWPLGHQNITVSYTHGYAVIPWDLKEACMTLAARGLLLSAGSTVSSEQIGTYQVTYSDATGEATLGLEKNVLDRYRYVTHPG